MKGLALELIRAPGRSIDLVSQQRVSQARHMDTDLMGTAGFQTALNMGKARKALQHPVMGHRRLAVLVVDAHFFPLLGMAANGGVYDTLVLLHHSMDNGLVPSGYGMLLQLGGNGIVLLTAVVVLLGVDTGVEKASSVMMPVLVLLSVGISVYCMTLPGAAEGLKYYLLPDFADFP